MAQRDAIPGEFPQTIPDEAALDELLSRPTHAVIDVFKRMQGDLVILGGSGKIGPSLVTMACRARDAAGSKIQIRVPALWPDPAARAALEKVGATTVDCDLLDPDAVHQLQPAANVVYMVGMKFGTSANPAATWAVNAIIPAYVGRRFGGSRMVVFSTGCVYPLVPIQSGGSKESDDLCPLGEYSNSCVARERVLEACAQKAGTKLLLERLFYAVDLRYGVLVDVATQIAQGTPVDVTMGYANVMWQGDVNAMTLRLLEHAAHPAVAMNVTGPQPFSIRQAAEIMAKRMGKPVSIVGKEAKTALLPNCTKMLETLGEPLVSIEQLLAWVPDWVARGGRLLGKPTHFQERAGKY